MKRPKIAMVVQRYGIEVNGGSELSSRLIAERLKEYFDVEVLTTKALDYMTWDNHYRVDQENINGITVKRFDVDYLRNVQDFNELSSKVLTNPNRTVYEELEWMKLQGPISYALLDYIRNHQNEYEAFIFFTYTYFTTYFGMQLVPEKAVFIPTAHDEPHAYLSIYKKLFHLPRSIAYLTPEEKEFVENFYSNNYKKSEVIGFGVDLPRKTKNVEQFKEEYDLKDKYVVYVGRIDESKGCRELFDYYLKFCNEDEDSPVLVLMGKPVMEIPKHKKIRSLGFVSEEDKFAGIAGAEFMIMPSPYESLSISVLESLAMGTPVVVNEKSEVLKGHCLRSNAGLYFNNYEEFKLVFKWFKEVPNEKNELWAINAKNYISENYTWENCVKKLISLLPLPNKI